MKSTHEVWNINKCKRVVRPLLAKIHSLNDMVTKNPNLLDIDCNSGGKDPGYLGKLTKPGSAHQRLEALKPLLSHELYTMYDMLFRIFKLIVITIESKRLETPLGLSVPKLAKLCSYNIGKAMVLSSRTSYYKLNQAALFDAKTLPGDLKLYNSQLSADIDQWLELKLEAGSIVQHYRVELLVGYIIHLLVFNRDLLFLLIPVLVHWLYEELIFRENSHLKHILSKLFYEYWYFNSSSYYENIPLGMLTQLTGHTYPDSKTNIIFCWLMNIDYWYRFITSLGFQSSVDSNHYETFILDSLMNNNTLASCDLNTAAGRKIYGSVDRILRITSHHLQLNNILITLLTLVIKKASHELVIVDSFTDFKRILQIWLSFTSGKEPMLFNSLLPRNEELFHGVITFGRYLTRRLHMSSDIVCTLTVLKYFFLDIPVTESIKEIAEQNSDGILAELIQLQKSDVKLQLPLKYSNFEINDFIYWLLDNDITSLGESVFLEFYGDFKRYYDDDLNELNRLIG